MLLRIKESLSKELVLSLAIALAGASVVFFSGIGSDVFRGDETVHYRIAEQIYDTKSRPIYDPVLHTSEYGKRYYNVEMLWHFGLAGFWGLLGGKSQISAQLYQALWYFSLVMGVYLLAQEIYGRKVALYSALLTASIPSALAYTIMLYLDIPASVLSIFCIFFVLRNRYIAAGILLGLMILTKRNTCLFIPPLVFWTLFIVDDIHRKVVFDFQGLRSLLRHLVLNKGLMHLVILAIMTMVFVGPDLQFRSEKLHTVAFKSADVSIPQERRLDTVFVHPSSIVFHPEMVVKEMGVALLFSLLIYVVYRGARRDVFILSFILSYAILFPLIILCMALFIPFNFDTVMYLLHNPAIILRKLYTAGASSLAIRYFIPIFPLLAIMGAKALVDMNSKKLLRVMAFICLLQGMTTVYYIYNYRTIPEGLREAYSLIRENVSPGTTVLCANSALVMYTNCKVMWNSDSTMPDMAYLFYQANEEEILEILQRYKIEYILVEKEKVVDVGKIMERGAAVEGPCPGLYNVSGFPESFIMKLCNFSFMKQVNTNKDTTLWKVN